MDDADRRRPSLKKRPSRHYKWPHQLAHFFVRCGMSPNQMSLLSIGFAALGALDYLLSNFVVYPTSSICMVGAAIFIQLRLVANMVDGLMAVEEGKKTPNGALYNELPDRMSDTLFLIAAGYAAGWPMLGWLAALLAVATAYVRAFGSSLGFEQDFSGPMAKNQRMFVLTAGSLIAAFLPHQPILALALLVIIGGCVITMWRRISRLSRNLSADF